MGRKKKGNSEKERERKGERERKKEGERKVEQGDGAKTTEIAAVCGWTSGGKCLNQGLVTN